MGAIPLPFLFSADRPPSPLVAAFSRVADSGRPAGIPRDLLLLPEGLLSRVLSRPPGLYGQRGPQNVSRRDGISLHPAKSASLFFLYRGDFPRFFLALRRSCLLLRWRPRCRWWYVWF